MYDIIDFSELGDDPKGERLEGLARQIGLSLGLNPSYSGRGSDGGRDLYFSDELIGRIGKSRVHWLVSCKNKSKSDKSVNKDDLGNFLVDVRQHKCDGFLIITTTVLSEGARQAIERLDKSNGGEIFTEAWDRLKLSSILTLDDCEDVFEKFFPKSYERYKFDSPVSRAIVSLQGVISGELLQKIREEVGNNVERRKRISGSDVWPYEKSSADTIDTVLYYLLERSDSFAAARAFCDRFIEFDAAIELFSMTSNMHSVAWGDFLENIIRLSFDEGVQFNALMFLRDHSIMSLSHEYSIAEYLSQTDVLDVYGETLQAEVIYGMTENYDEEDLFEELKGVRHYELDYGYVVIEKLEFKGGVVYFEGKYEADYRVDYDDPDGSCDYVQVSWEFFAEHGDFGLRLSER